MDRNLTERNDSIGSMASASVFPKFQFLHLSQALAAGAWSAGERGDVPAFQEMAKDGDHFLRGIYQDEVGTLEDEESSVLFARTLAQNFAGTAAKVGLREEADVWKTIGDDVAKRQDHRNRKFEVDGKEVAPGTVTGSILGGSVEKLGKYLYCRA